MDEQAQALLATLKKSSVAIDTKLAAFNNLKSSIKHQRVPDSSAALIFECVRIGIGAQTSPTLVATTFSTLGHLVKRLSLQEQGGVVGAHAAKLLPLVQERLGDARENLRNAASQALADLWPFARESVERVVREGALGGHNARAKEVAMMWIVKMNRTDGLQFKSFVPSLVAALEDPDGGVRETAKSCIVELFGPAPERAKNDLKKQMVAHDVRRTIMSFIMQHLGLENSTELDLGASAAAPSTTHAPSHGALSDSVMSEQATHSDSPALDPLFVHSARELEDTFRDMAPPFEGKETEHNWMARDKNITKMRRMLQGNAPSDFQSTFVAGIKSMLDSIIRFTNTLRTTPSTNACQLCQELYRILGTAMDPMTEMMIQNFVKMSAATKHITAKQADVSMETILANCSFSSRIMQHIWLSFQEKNMQTRSFAPGWLKIIMKKGASHRSQIEHAGGIELIDKCLKKGLEDASPKVRESTRSAYWTYAQIWHSQAERLMESLDDKMRQALEKDPNNPHKPSLASSVSSITSTKSKTTNTMRPSVRDAIAAQRRAALQKNLPERPNSAQSSFASTETPSTRHPIRGAVSKPSTLSKTNEVQPQTKSAINAGPVRRPKKADMPRPATADPYSSRNIDMARQTTPTISPQASPAKSATAAKTTAASAIRTGGKTPARTPAATTPAIRGKARAEAAPRPSPKQATHVRNHSMPISPTPKEETMTLVLPTRSKPAAHSPAGVSRPEPTSRSRDSDATMASEADSDGFTMVIPSLKHDEDMVLSRPTSSGTPTKSFLPRRSPIRGANENAKPGSPLARKFELGNKSISPERSRLGDIEQVDAGAVQVYEDPFQADETNAAPVKPTKAVLEEIVINDKSNNSRTNSTADLGQAFRSNEQNTEAVHPRDQIKSNANGSALTPGIEVNDPLAAAEIMKSKRLLTSAIERVRAKSLDAHGFRRVQELIKSNHDIWGENTHKFRDLLLALLDYIQAPAEQLKIPGASGGSKAQNLKTQVLATIRGMLALHRREAGPYFARSLCALLTARSQFDDMSHIASELERTVDEICRTGPASDCLDAVLDLLEALPQTELNADNSSADSTPSTSPASPHAPAANIAATVPTTPHGARTVILALHALTSLLAVLPISSSNNSATAPSPRKQQQQPSQAPAAPSAPPAASAQISRLGHVAVALLQCSDPEIRRADMEFCLALHDRLGAPEAGADTGSGSSSSSNSVFWTAVQGAPESGLNLLTYFLARRGRAAAAR